MLLRVGDGDGVGLGLEVFRRPSKLAIELLFLDELVKTIGVIVELWCLGLPLGTVQQRTQAPQREAPRRPESLYPTSGQEGRPHASPR